jgi:hypothetical protein
VIHRLLVAAACIAAFAAAGLAAAAEPPHAAGDARLGSLHVTSGIIVSAKSADLRGIVQRRGLRAFVSGGS